MAKDIFISYSRTDSEHVDVICEQVEGFLLSKGLGGRIFLDREDIHTSDNFLTKLAEALKACKILVFFSSNASVNSSWVETELINAKNQKIPMIVFMLEKVIPTKNNQGVLFLLYGARQLASTSNELAHILNEILEESPSAGNSVIKFHSVHPCTLYHGDNILGRISENTICRIEVPTGHHTFTAISTEYDMCKLLLSVYIEKAGLVKHIYADFSEQIMMHEIRMKREHSFVKGVTLGRTASILYGNYHMVEDAGLYVIKDDTGQKISPFHFRRALPNKRCPIVLIEKYDGWFFFNLLTSKLYNAKYDNAELFGDIGYIVMKSGKYGVIGFDFAEIIPVKYERITFSQNRITGIMDNTKYMLDSDGNILETEKCSLDDVPDDSIVKKYNGYGICKTEKHSLFFAYSSDSAFHAHATIYYHEINRISTDIFAAKLADKWGIISPFAQSPLLPFEYSQIKAINNVAIVLNNNGYKGLFIPASESICGKARFYPAIYSKIVITTNQAILENNNGDIAKTIPFVNKSKYPLSAESYRCCNQDGLWMLVDEARNFRSPSLYSEIKNAMKKSGIVVLERKDLTLYDFYDLETGQYYTDFDRYEVWEQSVIAYSGKTTHIIPSGYYKKRRLVISGVYITENPTGNYGLFIEASGLHIEERYKSIKRINKTFCLLQRSDGKFDAYISNKGLLTDFDTTETDAGGLVGYRNRVSIDLHKQKNAPNVATDIYKAVPQTAQHPSIMIVSSEFGIGLATKRGTTILPSIYEYIDEEYPQYGIQAYLIKKNCLWGMFDINGHIILDCKYDAISRQRKYLIVSYNGKYGVFSYDGLELCPCIYDEISGIAISHKHQFDLFLVKHDNSYRLLNMDNRSISTANFQEILPFTVYKRLYFKVRNNSLWGVVRENFATYIPIQFSSIELVGNNLIMETPNNQIRQLKVGQALLSNSEKPRDIALNDYIHLTVSKNKYIVKKNEMVIAGPFDAFKQLTPSLYIAKREHMWAFFDRNIIQISDFEYDRIELNNEIYAYKWNLPIKIGKDGRPIFEDENNNNK